MTLATRSIRLSWTKSGPSQLRLVSAIIICRHFAGLLQAASNILKQGYPGPMCAQKLSETARISHPSTQLHAMHNLHVSCDMPMPYCGYLVPRDPGSVRSDVPGCLQKWQSAVFLRAGRPPTPKARSETWRTKSNDPIYFS